MRLRNARRKQKYAIIRAPFPDPFPFLPSKQYPRIVGLGNAIFFFRKFFSHGNLMGNELPIG